MGGEGGEGGGEEVGGGDAVQCSGKVPWDPELRFKFCSRMDGRMD